MSKEKNSPSPQFGLVAGVAAGLLVGVVFKKLALGILLGIVVAYLFYRSSKDDGNAG
jgi:type III secretory pathway component EscT